jgi:hypothetical protein
LPYFLPVQLCREGRMVASWRLPTHPFVDRYHSSI